MREAIISNGKITYPEEITYAVSNNVVIIDYTGTARIISLEYGDVVMQRPVVNNRAVFPVDSLFSVLIDKQQVLKISLAVRVGTGGISTTLDFFVLNGASRRPVVPGEFGNAPITPKVIIYPNFPQVVDLYLNALYENAERFANVLLEDGETVYAGSYGYGTDAYLYEPSDNLDILIVNAEGEIVKILGNTADTPILHWETDEDTKTLLKGGHHVELNFAGERIDYPIIEVSNCTEGVYLRWMNQFGLNVYYLFNDISVSSKTKSHNTFTVCTSDLRPSERDVKSRIDSIRISTGLIDHEEYETVKTLENGRYIQMYDQQYRIWLDMLVSDGSLTSDHSVLRELSFEIYYDELIPPQ